MEKHYLSPLFTPQSVIVFAGQVDAPEQLPPQARMLVAALQAQTFTGLLRFLDIHSTGTLADLAQSRADLAVIALPPEDLTAALEIAGRIACKAAVIVSSGISAELAASLAKIAKREGVQLLGPNSLGLQRPQLQLNASLAGPLAHRGPLALVSQSGALTSSILDWAKKNAVEIGRAHV